MPTRLSKLLLPTDFSEVSRPAIEYACFLAAAFEGELHCLHVVDDAYQYWSAIGPESLPLGPPPDEMLALARQRMSRFREEYLGGSKRPPVTHVAYGRPFAEIVAYAEQQGIDLIVMGTHGRGPIAHALLGSTTEKVIRKAPCAVLTVRTLTHPTAPR